MIRGTTPTLSFRLPFDTNTLKKFYITFNQNEKTILEKTAEDCILKGNVISLSLNQEETLAFAPKGNVKIQIRAKTLLDEAIASNIIITTVGDILKDGEI